MQETEMKKKIVFLALALTAALGAQLSAAPTSTCFLNCPCPEDPTFCTVCCPRPEWVCYQPLCE
jgi:hypothetical protein